MAAGKGMRRPDPFVEHLLDLMAPLAARVGPLSARRMFGGHGLFYDGLMFALVAGGRCYLKADDETAPRFAAAGSEPFRYQTAAREVALRHYLSLPSACLDSVAEMTPWARMAVEAALRMENAKRR